jgi:hypothetical protein
VKVEKCLQCGQEALCVSDRKREYFNNSVKFKGGRSPVCLQNLAKNLCSIRQSFTFRGYSMSRVRVKYGFSLIFLHCEHLMTFFPLIPNRRVIGEGAEFSEGSEERIWG